MTAQKSKATAKRRRGPGRPFPKGQSGNPRGRTKGVPNKVTVEARKAATELVDDPVYRKKLKADLQRRKVAPAIEALLWHYAKGKPVERHEVGQPGDFSTLSDDELKARVAELARRL